jgi:cilia- and flagella-associated protein 69
MCMNNKLAQKEFRRKGGIECMKKNLNYQNILNQIGNQKIFILVVLDCLWNSVIGNKRNEEQFIELDGLFTLFDVLEQSDDIHIKIILSCIASLVDNKRSYSYFIQWKSNSNSNVDATKLLINVYRDEDKKYGVEYDNGILNNNIRTPLNPNTSYLHRKLERQNFEENEKKKMKNTKRTSRDSINDKDIYLKNAAVTLSSPNLEMSEIKDANIYRSEDFIESYLNHKISEITKTFDLRETIFSIFYRIGFNNITITSPEDDQTFVIVKMYPIFKNLENWLDVIEELDDLVNNL